MLSEKKSKHTKATCTTYFGDISLDENQVTDLILMSDGGEISVIAYGYTGSVILMAARNKPNVTTSIPVVRVGNTMLSQEDKIRSLLAITNDKISLWL